MSSSGGSYSPPGGTPSQQRGPTHAILDDVDPDPDADGKEEFMERFLYTTGVINMRENVSKLLGILSESRGS